MSRLSGASDVVEDAATKLVSTDTAVQSLSAGMAGSAAAMTDLADGLVADSTAMAKLRLGNQRPITTGEGSGTSGSDNYSTRLFLNGTGLIVTEILMDIDGLASATTDNEAIGTGTDANAHFGRILAESGTIIAGKMECLQTPTTGEPDLDLYGDASGTIASGSDGTTDTALLESGIDWTTGTTLGLTGFPAANDYLYLTVGHSSADGATYGAGIFLVTFYGV